MALIGTLTDLGIVDLIQFPHGGRKSGELVIADADHEARLYYTRGNLIHAAMAEQEGIEVLVELVAWTEGQFEFRQDVATEKQSIELDLHHVVMQALKLRDERVMEETRRRTEAEEQRRQAAAGAGGGELDPVLCALLSDFVATNTFVSHVCVLAPDGVPVAEADGPAGPPEGVEGVRLSLATLADTYLREGLIRIIVEDAQGTAVYQRCTSEGAVVAIANKSGSLGAVSVAVGKLIKTLAQGGGR